MSQNRNQEACLRKNLDVKDSCLDTIEIVVLLTNNPSINMKVKILSLLLVSSAVADKHTDGDKLRVSLNRLTFANTDHLILYSPAFNLTKTNTGRMRRLYRKFG